MPSDEQSGKPARPGVVGTRAVIAARKRIERRLAAILSADIKGYSLMMGADEETTHTRVGIEIDRLLRHVARHNGRVFTFAGDGLCIEFISATAALRCAVAFQRESAQRNARLPEPQRILFRIGINAGNLLVKADRVGGNAVNIAVRLQDIAPAGGICISQEVHEQVSKIVPLDYEFMGEVRLKNIAVPVPAFRAGGTGSIAVPAADRAAPDHPPAIAIGPTLAVLPFDNLSDAKADAYFCDGVVDDIITGLSRFRALVVIGRHSSFSYRGRRVRTDRIARQLGVRYLVTGNVRKAASRIRITAQLLDGLGGQTLWAERYDGELREVFTVQDDLIRMIVARVAARLEGLERDRLRVAQPNDLRAYENVLRGQELVWRFEPAANFTARHFFEQARDHDPHYARCYAALSRTYNWEWRYSWTEDRNRALDTGFELAKRSLSLDEMDARAYSELGFAHLYRKERELAIAAYQRALELNPNDADVMAELADAYTYDDQLERALELMAGAMRLNPFYPDWYLWYLADTLFSQRRYEEVIATLQRMKNPSQGHRMMAASFAHLGRMDEARLHAGEVLRHHPNFSIARWSQVPPEKIRERLEHLVVGMRLAGLPD